MAKQNVVEMEEPTRQQFENLVLSHFGPQILTNTKVYLACAMQTSLVCDQPTATILVGPSSSGKTLASWGKGQFLVDGRHGTVRTVFGDFL